MNHRRTKRKKTKRARKTFARRAVKKNKKKDQRLSKVRDLENRTPILVPNEFVPPAVESFTPSRGLAEGLLRHGETALTNLRATLEGHAARPAEQSDQAQDWLKSDRAKEFLRRSPELKQVFVSASAAATALPKEQAAAIAMDVKALDKVRSQMAKFRKTSSA
jgi:hypothetical protein